MPPLPDRRILRTIDANLNRAREGLRVLEDALRYGADDAEGTAALKRIRHTLEEIPAALGTMPEELLAARDAAADVGRERPVEGGGGWESRLAANWKRLQEALRSIEESARALGRMDAAVDIERLRFESYELEKRETLATGRRRRLEPSRLYAILSWDACRNDPIETIRALARGGVDLVQLREKKTDDRTLLERARAAAAACREAGMLFLINDRTDIALAAGADGVHLGQEDLPVTEARTILGEGRIVGVSTHSPEQARQAVTDGADYVGFGPIFSTPTKPGRPAIGPGELDRVTEELPIPVFAIGGIDTDNIANVVAAGAQRVAAVRALVGAEDPVRAARLLREPLPG